MAGTIRSTAGSMSHYDGSVPAGILPGIVDQTILLPTDDIAAVQAAIRARDDIAAVIIEGSGASWGAVPLPPRLPRRACAR